MSFRKTKTLPERRTLPVAENRFEQHPRLTLTATLLACIGMILVGAEMIARWIDPLDTGKSFEYRIPDPRFGWVLAPGASYINRLPEESVRVSYNADGWRDLPHAKDKAKGVVRIEVLGDSFMEAYSVRFEDALPARLEHLTNTAGRRTEVLNFGVGGYGTLQEYLVFDAAGRAYHPDVVVLAMFLGNDLSENSQTLQSLVSSGSLKDNARPFLDPEVSDPDWRVTEVDFEGARRRYDEYRRQQAEPLNRVLRHSALLQIGQRALGLDQYPRHPDTVSRERQHLVAFGVHYCDEPKEYVEAWDVTRRILKRLDRDVRAVDARLLVMSVPAIDEVDQDVMAKDARNSPRPLCLEEAYAYRRLGELLNELHIDYLDLLPAFRDARRQTGVELFRRSDQHWNPQGHALGARELAAALQNRGYLTHDAHPHPVADANLPH